MSSLEFEQSGHTYRAGKLDAKKQLHVVRRLAPLFAGLVPVLMANKSKAKIAVENILDSMSVSDLEGLAKVVTTGMATLPDADVDFILDTCLAAVEREQTSGGWARIMNGGKLQFQDLGMAGMLTITWKVLQHNLTGFFGMLPQSSPGKSRT